MPPNADYGAVPIEPFHTFDHHGNEYVIEHGNVAIDASTPVVLWPLAVWRAERERRREVSPNDGSRA